MSINDILWLNLTLNLLFIDFLLLLAIITFPRVARDRFPNLCHMFI